MVLFATSVGAGVQQAKGALRLDRGLPSRRKRLQRQWSMTTTCQRRLHTPMIMRAKKDTVLQKRCFTTRAIVRGSRLLKKPQKQAHGVGLRMFLHLQAVRLAQDPVITGLFGQRHVGGNADDPDGHSGDS